MEATAGHDVPALGLTFKTFPPDPVIVKATVKDKWGEKVGFVGGEEVFEVNSRSTSEMTADEFKAMCKDRPLTLKFRPASRPAAAAEQAAGEVGARARPSKLVHAGGGEPASGSQVGAGTASQGRRRASKDEQDRARAKAPGHEEGAATGDQVGGEPDAQAARAAEGAMPGQDDPGAQSQGSQEGAAAGRADGADGAAAETASSVPGAAQRGEGAPASPGAERSEVVPEGQRVGETPPRGGAAPPPPAPPPPAAPPVVGQAAPRRSEANAVGNAAPQAQAQGQGRRVNQSDPAAAGLDAQADAILNAPGGLSTTAGLLSLIRSRLKAAGLQKFGLKWTKLFDQLDLDRSGFVSWEEFRLAVRNLLKLQEDDVHLRIVFRSLDTDRSGSIAQDELVAFVADPVARMRQHLRTAMGLQTTEEYLQFFRDNDPTGSGKLDWNQFLALCYGKMKVVDGQEQLWTVYKALAGQSQLAGEVSLEAFAEFVAEGDGASGKRPAKTRDTRREEKQAHAAKTLARVNGTQLAEQGAGIAPTPSGGGGAGGHVRIAVVAPKYGVGQRDLLTMVDSNPFMQVTIPETFNPTSVAGLDESRDGWVSLTLDDWVIAAVRHPEDQGFGCPDGATMLVPGLTLLFISRDTAVATGYPPIAGGGRSQDVVDNLQLNAKLPEDIVICRTDHAYRAHGPAKGRPSTKGRVSLFADKGYVVLQGAEMVRREGDYSSFKYHPLDRIRRNFGPPERTSQMPAIDVHIFAEPLVTEKDGMRLGPDDKDGTPGLDLRGRRGLTVLGVAVRNETTWEPQWCPPLSQKVRAGDLCFLLRYWQAPPCSLDGLVHVAEINVQ